MAPSTAVARSRKLLEQAEQLLAQGDLSQASAKGWAGATDALARFAISRGWDHAGRRDFYKAITRIVAETDDREYHTTFTLAGELDTNSDEGFLSAEAVGYHLTRVSQFVNKIEALLDAP